MCLYTKFESYFFKDQDETLMDRTELYMQTKNNRSSDASENEDEEQGLEVLLSFSKSEKVWGKRRLNK